jgi:hypothetical protein
MARDEGGRWDVGLKDRAVHVERVSEDDKSLFDDLLAPDEARELAGLLTKFADKVEETEDSDETEDSGETEDSDKSETSKESDDSDKPEDSDKSSD